MRATYEAKTALALGARGELAGASFTLVGRTCVKGPRGAIWNEWALRFDDGKRAFIAESGAGLSLYEDGSILPPMSSLVIGAPIEVDFIVVERGEATRVARWGEVDDVPPTFVYAGLTSRSGALATIDYASDPPRTFVGRKVTSTELGLSLLPGRGAPLVEAPDVSRPKGVDTWLDVGDEGDLDGSRLRVVGALSRSMGVAPRVSWEEYLLFDADAGLRWLVVSEGQWSLVEMLPAGRPPRTSSSTVELDGVVYALASAGIARVDWATGELPWHVTVGEESSLETFVEGPWTLTRETTADELTWSRGRDVSSDAIAKAFGKRVLPRPPRPGAAVR